MHPTLRAGTLLTVCGLLMLSTLASVGARTTTSPQQISTLKGTSNWCVNQKTAIDCDLRSDCVWCIRGDSALGTGCYPTSAAKLMPKSWGLVCDKEFKEPGVQAAACDGRPEATCIAPECVWCVSAAVPAACYTPDEAKRLPAAVFKCKAAPSA